MENGYAICLNKWSLDKKIKNELGLLLIISSLCAEKGYCYASNKYLAEQFDITEQSVSNKIKILEKNNYIEVEYERRGAEITKRKIRLKNIYTDDIKKFIPTIKENFKENNISNKNISINKKEIYKEKFKKPSLEEVTEYCLERNNDIDPEIFMDFYETNGWVQGKNKPIKDWKACIRTWERNRKPNKDKKLTDDEYEKYWEERLSEEE